MPLEISAIESLICRTGAVKDFALKTGAEYSLATPWEHRGSPTVLI